MWERQNTEDAKSKFRVSGLMAGPTCPVQEVGAPKISKETGRDPETTDPEKGSHRKLLQPSPP